MNTELDPKQASDAYEITAEQPGITPEKAYQDAVDGQKPQPFKYIEPKIKKLLSDNLVAGGIITPEVEKYSDWERTWAKFGNSFEAGRNQNAVGEDSFQIMLWKNDLQMLSDYKTQDDYKSGVKRLATEMQKSQAYSALNKPNDVFVNIPSGVSTAIYQMVTNVTDNPSASGIGALVGLGTGGIPGAVKWGFTAGNTWGNFTKTAGSIYKEVIFDATDEEFKQRNPKQVMYIALGTAALSSGLEAFANKELIEGATGKFLATKAGQSLSASAVIASIKKGLNGETLKLVASLGETIASKLPEVFKRSGKYLGNAFMTQGLPEMGQELIEAKGTAMGKGQDLKFNKELGNQLANASLIGTFTTPVADTGAIVLGNAYYQGVATIARKKDVKDPLRVNMGEFQLREDLRIENEQLEKDKAIITELLDIENKISTKDNPVHDEVTDALATDRTWYVTKDALVSLEQKKAGFLKEFSNITGYELTDDNEVYNLSSKNLLRIAQYDAEIANKISHTPAGNTLETFETFTKKLDANKEKIQKVLESKNVEKGDEFSGVLHTVHGTQQDKLQGFETSVPLDEKNYQDSVFGNDAIYLDETGDWSAIGGLFDKPGSRGIGSKNVVGVETNFQRALIITPENVDKLLKLTEDFTTRKANALPTSVDRLKKQGYDGLILRGFFKAEQDALLNFIKKYPEYDKLRDKFIYNSKELTDLQDKEAYTLMLNQLEEEYKAKGTKRFGMEMQDQVVAFYPENSRVVKQFDTIPTMEEVAKFKQDQKNNSVTDLDTVKLQKELDDLNKEIEDVKNFTADDFDKIKSYVDKGKVQQIQDTEDDIKLLENPNFKYPFDGLKTVSLDFDENATPINIVEQKKKLIDQLKKSIEKDTRAILKSTPRILEKLENKKRLLEIKIDLNHPINELTTIIDSSTDGVFDVESNVYRDTITTLVADRVMTEDEAQLYQDTVTEARVVSAEQVLEQERQETQRAIKLDVDSSIESISEQIEDSINKNPGMKVEDFFDPSVPITPEAFALLREIFPEFKNKNDLEIQLDLLTKQKTKALNKYGIFAFDPETLPGDYKQLASRQRAKDKLVFVKGGIDWKHADLIAQKIFGYRDGMALLGTILNTPTKEEYRAEQYGYLKDLQTDESIKELSPQKEDFLKAFENKAKVYAKEIEFILKEKTGQARRMIGKLGKKFKPDVTMKRRAQTIAENVKMRDLNPKKFSRNQDLFQAKVTKAFADGDFFNMFQYKELQVLNALVEGYALDFRKRIERKSARVQMMGTKEGQKLLYAAGPEFVQAYNFLKGALDGKAYATSQLQDLIELYKPYTGTGIGPEFGQRIVQPRDTKVQQGDLTYKEVSAILDTMISINSLAKRAKSVKVSEQTVSMIEAQRQISLLARTNPLYDSKQSESLFNKDYDEPTSDIVMDWMGSVTSMFTTVFTTIQNRLDQGDVTGFFSSTFIVPLINGLSVYGNKKTQIDDYMMLKVKETIGIDAFNKLPTERVNIPEFLKRYKNGFSRFELLATTAHAMSESGRKKMTEEYGITDQQLLKVIEANVTDKELELIQSMMNYHDSEFFKNIYDRYIRLGQVPPEKVTALPTKIRGKEYAGGYWPLKKESEIYNKTKRMNQEITDVIKNKEIGKMLEPTDVVTKSGTEKERTDATGPYDLTFEGYMYKVKEMIHHDTFSETMINISNLLANDSIVNDMMNVMGKEQFTAFVASLEHFALGSHDFDIQAQVAMEPGRKILNFMTRNLNVAKMGGGIKTAARQYNSYGVMIESLVTQLKEPLSVDSAKAASSTIWNTVLNPMKLGKLAEAIAVVDPQFKNYVDSLKKLPMYKAAFGKESVFDVYATNQSDTGKYARKTQDFFMGHLQFIQLQLNTAAYMTAFNFAMDGKIKNIDKGDKKSARDFASTMVRITLSDDSALGQSAIQRQWWGKLFLFGQNQLNIVTNRAIGAHMRMGFARNQNGFDLRNKAFMSGLMTIVMAGVVPSILETALGNLYKNIVVPEEDEEEKKGTADKTLVAGLKGFLNLYPGFRSFAYDIEQITEQDKDITTLNTGNIYANSLTNVTSFVGSTLWAAHDSLRKEEEDRHRVSQNDIKTFTRSILDLSGIPGFNAPPIPLVNPTGKNLRNTISDSVIEKWFSDHPRRYDFSILSYNEPSDDRPKNIVDIITEIANDKNETVLAEQKPKEQADDVFIAAVEELQKPNLTYEQKQIQSAIRDRAYSVNGITNPEGHKITTNKGDVDLSDFRDREKITLWVRGLSRFETKDFTAMVSSSGASGYFHFTKGTWNSIKDQYPELNLPKTPLDASEAVQNQAYWKLLGENMIDLERLNQPLSLENIYLIHMMGYDDYKKFVQSSPGEDLEKLLPIQYEHNRGIVEPGTVQGIKDNVKDKLLDHIKEAYQDLKTENLLTP